MTKLKSILTHFPLKARDKKRVKKIILKTEKDEKKTKNARKNVSSKKVKIC